MFRSAEFIGWALGGIEREIAETQQRLAELTAQANRLRERVGRPRRGRPAAAARAINGRGRRRRRNMSAEGRKRISEIMKKRWAEYRKKKGAGGRST